ncbi:CO or xanthine dehydrogenase, Mo-binding subunit [Noviherbaspirillum humi]|uniref:CO or xanthine dehydrogenase, Mo-binding subunit n=1 Tax=Noviherbaspirillum humi TaxID=1688639 RepID=A0A239KJJ9_9BURK|nr:molybdopterin cofactor-binding domain-containing protein [Noviherbaspirillum humi]SNT18170.1 CO or xanthine dehydrogenase, Mo-binding subunit [Noviherbaspirillum humi]
MTKNTDLHDASLDLARRGFLKGGGALVVSFALAPAAFLKPSEAAAANAPGKPKSVAADEVPGFLAIDEKGMVTVYSGKVDLGTGVRTALMQIVAEELDTPFDRIRLIEGDTMLTPDQGTSSGSLSIQIGGMQIRQAAATAREALKARGAQALGVAPEAVRTADGKVVAAEGGRSLGYGELVAAAPLAMKVDAKAPLKDPATYTVVGKPVRRVDIPAKVTGEFTYMHDFRLPGMLHARVIRPAGIKSELLSFDDGAARKVKGFVQTVRKGNFLAVVAKSEWAAVKASRLVEARWSDWKGLPDKAKVFEHMRQTRIVNDEQLQKAGDADAALASAGKTLSADYHFAVHTHGSIGPSCSVADYRDGKMTVWTASQGAHNLRRQVAAMLSMKPDDVRCIYLDGSGCYGRNGHEDASGDAALIAREIGKPVRVQWMRHEEHGWDPKAVPTSLAVAGGLDAEGRLVAWKVESWLPVKPKESLVPLVAADHAGLPMDPASPGNIHQGMAIPYAVPNIRATAHWVESTPFRPSWIRTPGRMQNNFAVESFFDEMAHAAGVDPFEARMRNLTDPRGLELLQRLKEAVGWQPSAPRAKMQGNIARGRGVAYVKYEMVRTYVGAVADVEVNLDTGAIRVAKFTVAHDCGQVINPDGLKSQIDGNVIQTVSRTLVEDLQWDASNVTSLDWGSYPILRMPEVPKIDYVIIDRPNEKPWGAGEPSAAVIPAAIGNAVFDAIGVRLREVPFTPERVKAALRAAGMAGVKAA